MFMYAASIHILSVTRSCDTAYDDLMYQDCITMLCFHCLRSLLF